MTVVLKENGSWLGEMLGGYRLEEHIATGGYGSVWRALCPMTGDAVAVKILHESLVTSEEAVGRFTLEAQAIAEIDHRGVVALLNVARTPSGQPYMVTELIDGEDLGAVFRRGPVELSQVAAILDQLASALDAVHAVGYVHRDIKPGNVMLTEDGSGMRVVLLDFGIAKLAGADGPGLTASKFTVGTPSSMAPEQLCGEAVSPRTDVYGLGALAFTLLTGELPFSASPAMLLPTLHLHGDRPKPSSVVDVSVEIDAIIAKAMAPRAAERFESPVELAATFRAAAGSQLRAVPSPGHEPEFIAISVGILRKDQRFSDTDQDDVDDALDSSASILEELGYEAVRETGTAIVFGCELTDRLDSTQLIAQLRLVRQMALAKISADSPFAIFTFCDISDSRDRLALVAGWEPAGSRDNVSLYGSLQAIERFALPTIGAPEPGLRRLDL